MYEQNSKPLKDVLNNLDMISKEITETNKYMFNLFYTIINQQLEIINLNIIVSNYKNNTFSDVILSLCYKNLISLLSTVNLIKQGYIGSAKIIFRNVYEGLLIGKYMGLTYDYDYYEKWQNGDQISIKKDIFTKLVKKPSNESVQFWDILNKYTHSTVYSQDFALEYEKKELDNCHTIISCLLEMNYHLLNTFSSKYYNYYLKYYFGSYYKEKKENLKTNLSISRRMIDPRCKKVIKEYSAKWILE